jgi:hypothetical protein
MVQPVMCSHAECAKEVAASQPDPVPPARRIAHGQGEQNHTAPSSEIEGVPPRYVYIHTIHLNNQFVNRDGYAQDYNDDPDIIPDLLIENSTSTAYYTVCCAVTHLASI